jgi:hypothetical protein
MILHNEPLIYRQIELSKAFCSANPFRWARPEVAEPMSDSLIRIADYNQKINECIAMAKASTSNQVRAQHYALAEHYLRLFEAEKDQSRKRR